MSAIDKVETTVKVTPPSLVIGNNSNNSIINKRPSISRMWRHSMFHVNNKKNSPFVIY